MEDSGGNGGDTDSESCVKITGVPLPRGTRLRPAGAFCFGGPFCMDFCSIPLGTFKSRICQPHPNMAIRARSRLGLFWLGRAAA